MKLKSIKKFKSTKQTNRLLSAFFKDESSKYNLANCKRELKIITTYLKKRKKINFVDPPKDVFKHIKLHNQITVYRTGVLEDKILAELLTRNDLTVIFTGAGLVNKNTSKFLTKYVLLRKPVLSVSLKTLTNTGPFAKTLDSVKLEVLNCVLNKQTL